MLRRWTPRLLVCASALSGCGHSAPPPARPAPVTPAPTVQAPPAPAFGPSAIDAALREEWKRAGVTPAARADDATFLRRAYVDIVGTIPPVEVTLKFLADASPDKRAKLVDALLASPEYAEHWTNYWDDVLMGREARGPLVDRAAFRAWLQGRIASHSHWDRLVSELVSATGQNGNGGPKTNKLPGLAVEPAQTGEDGTINGAVNWTLRFEQNPQDLGGTASRVFLGVQIQCAQCHDHKTESWKQDDFRRFTSAFLRAKVEPLDAGKPMGLKRVELVDAPAPPPRFAKNADLAPVVRAKPTALDGTDLEKGAGTRKALAAWMTSKDNKWFAKAFVNRMWGHFLGRGFYDPVDDVRPSNPPTAPELLDRLTADFVAHDFDVEHLVRTISATEAYQLAARREPSAGDPENKLWGSFHLVPLGPEELLNAIMRATNVETSGRRAGIDVDVLRAFVLKQYAFVFDTDEEADAADYSGTITQALTLLNGALVEDGALATPGSAVVAIADGPGSEAEKVDALAVRVLARHATPEEMERWAAYVAGADHRAGTASEPKETRKAGRKLGPLGKLAARRRAQVAPRLAAYEDIMWTMLNSSEFSFNH